MPDSLLTQQIAHRTGLDAAICAAVLRGMADAVGAAWRQGLPANIPGVGRIEPKYLKSRSVACNLPNRISRRYNIGLRKTARLRPAPNLKSEEPYTGVAMSSPSTSRGGLTFIIP